MMTCMGNGSPYMHAAMRTCTTTNTVQLALCMLLSVSCLMFRWHALQSVVIHGAGASDCHGLQANITW